MERGGILHDPTHINVDKWQPLIYKFREYTTANQSLSLNFRIPRIQRVVMINIVRYKQKKTRSTSKKQIEAIP